MKIHELIAELSTLDPNAEIVLIGQDLDGDFLRYEQQLSVCVENYEVALIGRGPQIDPFDYEIEDE